MESPVALLLLLLLCLGALAPTPGSASSEAPPLVNEDVKRTVDLSSHLAKVTAEVVLVHPGGGSTSRASSFVLALEPELESRLAHLGVQIKGEDEEDNNLEVRETKIKGKSGRFFTVKLPVALDPGSKISVVVETVYTHVLHPYPTQITQSEKQFVVFEGNHYFYSPYPTKTQTMRVKLASRNVESYTKLGNPSRSEDVLDYGPFKDIPAYSQDTFKVHYENNSPFLTITSMTRVIEVSHWGNIAVEENVDLKHTGAVLKGPFSRYDYQRQPDSGISSIRSFKTILPAAAQDVYYRDEIGNVSTSHLLILDDSVEMEIRPRFPLFGGWKTHYIVGYNLPSYEYLYNLGDQYALKMRFVDHVFDEQVIDSLTVKIILPEGAKNIQVDSPYDISRAPDELHYTYLDTFGRPVIVAYKKNLVEQHIQDIVVHYTFNKVLMLQEPLLVVAAFYILFFTVIIYVRLDFSITKDPAAPAGRQTASQAGGGGRAGCRGRERVSHCARVREERSERASERAARARRPPAAAARSPQPPTAFRPAPRPGRVEPGRARAMLLTVYCVRRDLSEVTFSLQVDADFELHNFRALCELESGIPAAESQIVYAERPLTDNHRSLASYGLKDGDVVILRQKENADPRPAVQFSNLPRIDFSSIAVPGTSNPQQRQLPRTQAQHSSPGEMASSPQGLDNPALLRDMLLANPHELSLLKERNPPLAEALLSGDLEKFSRVLVEQQQDRARREQERIRLFSADPFDLEAQAKIEEDIRQQNIEENMTIAMEEAPESFGQVAMLYINCRVNGHPVKAFVDSGAQMTIMSQACAERCNIMRLVDRRWAGIAKGVGTQKIIGRVHLAQVQIEGDFLACSFSILEEQPMDMLLGLDMLKRHQCSIDLKKNVLVIGTTGSQTTFLPEGELPECARLAYGTGREDIRPEEIADQELAEAIQKSAEDAERQKP